MPRESWPHRASFNVGHRGSLAAGQRRELYRLRGWGIDRCPCRCGDGLLGRECLEGVLAPLRDSGAKVFGGVDYPHECRANSLDNDGMRGGSGIHVCTDAVVGLAIEDRGVDVRAQPGDPTGDPVKLRRSQNRAHATTGVANTERTRPASHPSPRVSSSISSAHRLHNTGHGPHGRLIRAPGTVASS